jgi:carbamoylphosphate synthase small subunit
MEVVNVEARTFEAMMNRFEIFADRIETLCRASGDKAMREWLDTQEVCELSGIQSKRTIQTYRDNGMLPHTRIENKIYYRPEDVERLMKRLNKRKEE